MEKIIIIGAGGFGREVQWLIERINQVSQKWEILGYLDDGIERGTLINGYPVLGGIDFLITCNEEISLACAIGSAAIRKKIIHRVRNFGQFKFPNLIDPSVIISDRVEMGRGNIICAGNILTVNIEIRDFVIINLDCTVGHDAFIDSFVTVYPSVNISGQTRVNSGVELGTGSQVIQGKIIGADIIIGAGAVVVHNIEQAGTYAGVPAKMIK